MRRSFFIALTTVSLAATAIGCGSAASTPDHQASTTTTPDSGPVTTTTPDSGTPAKPGGGPADPTADPIPADLPGLMAHGASADLPPDLSCAGKPLPVSNTTDGTEKEFHLVQLGGTDSDRVGGSAVEIFYANAVGGKPDVTATSANSEGGKDKLGVFQAKVPNGFVAFHVPKSEGYYDTTALDFDVRGPAPYLATVASSDKVDALSILIGGGTFTPTAGDGRLVVRAVDCAGNPLAGAHVVMEVDGVVAAIAKSGDDGVRKSYFTDTELPSAAKWTSRSGIIAFLNVPTGKSIRIVVRGKVGSSPDVVAMRKLPVVADGVLTAKITPYATP